MTNGQTKKKTVIDEKIDIEQVIYWNLIRIDEMIAAGATGNQIYNAVTFFEAKLETLIEVDTIRTTTLAGMDKKYGELIAKAEVHEERTYWQWALEKYKILIHILDENGMMFSEQETEPQPEYVPETEEEIIDKGF